jgi:hypothetical protein
MNGVGLFKEAVQSKLVDMLSRIRTESQYFKFVENWSPEFLKSRYPKAFKMMKIIQSNLGLIEGGIMNDVRGEVGGVMDKVGPYAPWVVAGLAVLTAGYFILKPKEAKPPIVPPAPTVPDPAPPLL